ncbi:glucose import [Tritrichomonas musculus]|uniref:Glucose import n=1 Tax=Tritrichomonas musculus TaxID=1915356 RepID=A0ABR2LAW7_9EUKA
MVLCSKDLLYAFIICMGPFTFGHVVAYPSPTGAEIRKLHHLSDNSLEWSFYNGVSSLTAIVGPFLSEFLLRFFKDSRKKTCFSLAVAATVFWCLNVVTKFSIWAGIAARALIGFVLGAFSSISPMFLVEIAPKGASGFYGSLNQLSLVFSSIILNCLGPHLNYLQLSIYCACFPLVQSALIWFVPEPSPDLEKRDDSLSEQNAEKESLWQKKYVPGLMVGILMMVFQQFCGINAVVTNLVDLMNASGLNFNPCYQAGIVQCSQCIAVLVGGILVDKLGRKIVWMISSGIVTIFLLIFALNTKYNWSNILPLISIFLYEFGFGIGFGPIPWFIIPEYFDFGVRALATEVVTAVNWTCAFAIIFLWPLMKEGLGMFGSFLLFMVIAFGALLYGLFYIHEPRVATLSVADNKIPLVADET